MLARQTGLTRSQVKLRSLTFFFLSFLYCLNWLGSELIDECGNIKRETTMTLERLLTMDNILNQFVDHGPRNRKTTTALERLLIMD